MSNLLQRIITGAIIASVAVCIAYRGGVYFAFFVLCLGALVFSEYVNITKQYYSKFLFKINAILYLIFGSLVLSGVSFYSILLFVCVCTAGLYFLSFVTKPVNYWMPFGFIYSSLPVVALIYIRTYSFMSIIYLFLIIWSTDIGGYVFGKMIGGKKIAPKISPKKTYSGAIGGLILSFIVVLIYLFINDGFSYNLLFGAIMLSIFSQYGDLFESAIKRKFKVKDSGNILPGHGGIMDRVDGLIFAAVVFALTLTLLK